MMLASLVLVAEFAVVAVFVLYFVTLISMYRDPEGRAAVEPRDPVGRALVMAARTGFLAGIGAVIMFTVAGVL